MQESDYAYPLPWHAVTDDLGLARELRREVGEGHPLAEDGVAPIARCQACDDVLFRLPDGTYAAVHLGWPHGDVAPDPVLPRRHLFDAFDDAVTYVENHEPDFEL